MDVREILADGVRQATEWLAEALGQLTAEQVNHVPSGDRLSIGANAWHVYRVMDNVTNAILRGQQPIWITGGYAGRFDLPRIEGDQGEARPVTINDVPLLREYGRFVAGETIAFVRGFPLHEMETVQQLGPAGELPNWRLIRQPLMTHAFLHLGEINAIRGGSGLRFSM